MDTPDTFKPSTVTMLAHLMHLFGGDLGVLEHGLVELAWNTPGERAVKHGQLYALNRLEVLAEHAAAKNVQGSNVYIGAALRQPGTAPFARAKDADFLGLTCAYVDLDKPGTVKAAKSRYGLLVPTLVVVTGLVPDSRAQLWWKLDRPITDPGQSQRVLKAMARALDGDSTVSNPSRVMRLAGSIAWPVKPDRIQELTDLLYPPGAAKEYGATALGAIAPSASVRIADAADAADIVPPRPAQPAAVAAVSQMWNAAVEQAADPGIQRQTDVFGLQREIVEGREKHMRDMVHAAIVNWRREHPDRPSGHDSLMRSMNEYEVYERTVAPQKEYAAHMSKRAALEEEGRGPTEWWNKWSRLMEKWDTDVAEKASIPNPNAKLLAEEFQHTVVQAEAAAKANPANQFELLDTNQILDMPDAVWQIEGLIVEHALGFIFGPPGSAKTFLALGVAMALVTKQPTWWGRGVKGHGAVIYISSEGHRSMKYRLRAWATHHGVDIRDTSFFLMKESINFMKAEDVGKLLATVEAAVARAGCPIAAIFVDTVSKVLPGAEENLQKDMTLFVEACARVRERFGTVVIGLHHTNAQGGIRGSTVIPGAGDFLLEVKREAGAMQGSVVAKKIKDAEDGWEQHFTVSKIELGDHASLVLDAAPHPPPDDGLPDRATCVTILQEIDEAWQRGAPFSHAANSARPAVKMLMIKHRLKREVVKRLLDLWVANDVIEETVFSFKDKVKGYRKLANI